MFLIKLALKNLTRHKRRTLITAFSIALGLIVFISYDAIFLGMEEESFSNIINLETGHLAVVSSDYLAERGKLSLELIIPNSSKIVELMKNNEQIVEVSPRVKFGLLLNNGINELPVMGVGIDPQRDNKVFTLGEYVIKGRMIASGMSEIILGDALADLMRVDIGDYVTLITKTSTGVYQAIDVEIVGLLEAPNPQINNDMVFIPLDIVQESLSLGDGATEIVARINNLINLPTVIENLLLQLDGAGYQAQVVSWEKLGETMIWYIKSQRGASAYIILFILIISLVGVVNVILLASLERTEEIGMMKALGLKNREIVSNFVVEGIGVGLLGGVIGCAISALIVLYLTKTGIAITMSGMPMTHIYGQWNPGAFIGSFILGGIVAFIASSLPAYLGARKDPIESLYNR